MYINNTLGKGCTTIQWYNKGWGRDGLWASLAIVIPHDPKWQGQGRALLSTRHHPVMAESRLNTKSEFPSHPVSWSSHFLDSADLQLECALESPGRFVKPGPHLWSLTQIWGRAGNLYLWQVPRWCRDHTLRITDVLLPQKLPKRCSEPAVQLWRTQIPAPRGLAH